MKSAMNISEKREPPYFDDDEARMLVGKLLLVGVTHRNHQDEVVGVEEFHGRIIRASREEGIVVRLSGSNEERWVPPDLSRLEPASPGSYRLKSSRDVVVESRLRFDVDGLSVRRPLAIDP